LYHCFAHAGKDNYLMYKAATISVAKKVKVSFDPWAAASEPQGKFPKCVASYSGIKKQKDK
jgi:hypothetical protein